MRVPRRLPAPGIIALCRSCLASLPPLIPLSSQRTVVAMVVPAHALPAAFRIPVRTVDCDLEAVAAGPPIMEHLVVMPQRVITLDEHKAACKISDSAVTTLRGRTTSELILEAVFGTRGHQAAALVLASRILGTVPPPMLPVMSNELEVTWVADSYLAHCHKSLARLVDPKVEYFALAASFQELLFVDRVGRQTAAARVALARRVPSVTLLATRSDAPGSFPRQA